MTPPEPQLTVEGALLYLQEKARDFRAAELALSKQQVIDAVHAHLCVELNKTCKEMDDARTLAENLGADDERVEQAIKDGAAAAAAAAAE